ncbi:MAG: UPF0280 family protein [Candidatus Omnitrophica bacterium]|nr:UPF0280 family protein [Candidatus Omnitrophota bacterium]
MKNLYRDWIKSSDLIGFQVTVKETELFVKAERDLSVEAVNSIVEFRGQIEEYIAKDSEFKTALKPYSVSDRAPLIVKEMAKVSSSVGVGPFASVAGAIAEYVGKDLLKHSRQIIVENGGDIFIKSAKNRVVGIYAGSSSFNRRVGLEIKAEETPLGICTSSGTIGHSLSFGKADAVVVLSKSTLLADASATCIGNLIKKKTDIPQGIRFAQKINGLKGVVIIKDDKMGIWGEVKICQI